MTSTRFSTLVAIVFCTLLLLSACVLPVDFDAKVEVDFEGTVSYSVEGTVAYLPLAYSLADGITEAEHREDVREILEDLQYEPTVLSADYRGNGLFWISLNDTASPEGGNFLYDLMQISRDGDYMIIEMPSLEDAQEYYADLGLKPNGQVTIASPLHVQATNGTEIGGRYVWDNEMLATVGVRHVLWVVDEQTLLCVESINSACLFDLALAADLTNPVRTAERIEMDQRSRFRVLVVLGELDAAEANLAAMSNSSRASLEADLAWELLSIGEYARALELVSNGTRATRNRFVSYFANAGAFGEAVQLAESLPVQQRLEAVGEVVWLLAANGEIARASAHMDQMESVIRATPSDPDYTVHMALLGSMRLQIGDEAGAEAMFREVRANGSEQENMLVERMAVEGRAKQQMLAGEFAEAISTLRSLDFVEPRTLALVQNRIMGEQLFDLAAEVAELHGSARDRQAVLLSVIREQIEAGLTEGALSTLAKLNDDVPAKHALTAEAFAAAGSWIEAFEHAQRVDDESFVNSIIERWAVAQVKAGDIAGSLETASKQTFFQDMTGPYPTALIEAGRSDLALSFYTDRVAKDSPDMQAYLIGSSLINSEVSTHGIDAGMRMAEAIGADPVTRVLASLRHLGRLDEAQKLLGEHWESRSAELTSELSLLAVDRIKSGDLSAVQSLFSLSERNRAWIVDDIVWNLGRAGAIGWADLFLRQALYYAIQAPASEKASLLSRVASAQVAVEFYSRP